MNNKMDTVHESEPVLHYYEMILLGAGLFMLISVAVLYAWGDLSVWALAKLFYAVGVLLFSWYA